MTLPARSHPTRVRGLKSKVMIIIIKPFRSHPTRVRGLKYLTAGFKIAKRDVAPYAGAWIEIKKPSVTTDVSSVAPYAGAWIEMGRNILSKTADAGRTLRGCVD